MSNVESDRRSEKQLRIAHCHLSIAKDIGNGQSAIHNPQLLFPSAPTRTRTWNPLIKSPAMISHNGQNRAVLGSLSVITCHKLPSISIESLHFHCTDSIGEPDTGTRPELRGDKIGLSRMNVEVLF